MKLVSWKSIAIVFVALLLTIAGVFYFNDSTGNKSIVTQTVNPAFAAYISAYTSGAVSARAPLRIVLTENVVDSAQVGRETSVRLFDFSPSVSGKTVWVDKNIIEFKPEHLLNAGQVYEARFFLSKLMPGVDADLETFEYNFQVLPQNYEVNIENITPYIKTDLKRQRAEGVFLTADYADNASVEKTLSASQDGASLKIQWTHNADGRQHFFSIEEIARRDAASRVSLAINASDIGIERNETREIEIPSLSDFKLMDTKVVQNPDQYVVLQFSDPLKESQDVRGLISIDDVGTLDYKIQDNEIHVYPSVRQTGTKTIRIEPGIRNIIDYRMSKAEEATVVFEQMNPSVRFVGKGNILPSSNGLILPFEAVNLKSIDVQIIKVYEANVLQFLQVNNFDGRSELRRVGKNILKKNVTLEGSGVADLGRWNRFTLDLAELITTEPGAIYQVQIGFKKKDIYWTCQDDDAEGQHSQLLQEEDWSEPENENSYWDSYEDYYYDEDYDWNERNNPCHSSYYVGDKSIKRNVIASDLGLIAKRGTDGNTVVFVTDLKTTSPLSGVAVELFDYQQQVIASGATDSEGRLTLNSKDRPFALVAKNGSQRGYLKLFDGESLSLSNFNVGGEQISKGLKGLIYGERGVWRPGDSLYLTFVLEDESKTLPENHPVVMELQNPQGQIVTRLVKSRAENGFYNFATATSADAPTGNWTSRVKVGGAEFIQPIKIETVKPNRLKINLDFGKDKLTAEDNNIAGTLQVNWLHGAPGRNLKASFEVLMTKAETKFEKYPGFVFEDPGKEFYSEAQQIFEGSTDADGHATIMTTLDPAQNAPGFLNAVFRGKVYEESGNFSIDRFSVPFYSYSSYTGIRLPEGDKARGMLLTDTTHRLDVVTVDANGKPVSRSHVHMSIQKLQWRWWWDNTEENAAYMSDSYATMVNEGNIQTVNGKGSWTFKINYPEWGRYLVKAYDPVSGHSTAKVVYIDWPGWAGRAREGSDGVTMLTFTSDKPLYNIGEKASIIIPAGNSGRALVTIENGSRVIQSHWLETQKGDNPFTFEVTKEMTPNIFVHVTLIQPHAQTFNDLPIRLYGVIPITVEDEETHLYPQVSMPDVLEPGSEVVVKVSEKTNRKMTYTLAVVDEGLLDLTRFRTPDLWSRFYAREALGVKTWDMYAYVMGAFGSEVERLLAIGGDFEGKTKEDDSKTNRFKPVVKFFGPFTLSGDSDEITFTMPQYVGSVKTMLVAGYEGAYGSTEKVTPVRKPLMVLATLPRVLGPEEKLKLPVTLFSMEKSIKNVKVQINVSGPLELPNKTQNVTMSGADMTVDFDLNVKAALGKARVEVTATSGSYSSTDVIDIEVRNPNPPITRSFEAIVEAGKSWSNEVSPIGMDGTNSASLEVSALPPINLGQRLKYLLQYPYGCVEQTTSSVFPQLFVDQIKVLSEGERTLIQYNVRAGIDKLKSFQQRDGGFTYWPGGENADSWSTTYAGHFLVEAETKGYHVPAEMIRRWKRYQRDKANAWRKNREFSNSELIQAYRLYTLALAGDADMGAMNRLREQSSLPLTASWMLAAAYAKAGQPEAAKNVISKLSIAVKPYQELAYTYGSDLRDKAIILETLLLTGDRTRAFELLREISLALSNESQWLSTQTIAWCLKSAGAFAGNEKKGDLKFDYSYNGKRVSAQTELAFAQVALPIDGAKANSLNVVNRSGGVLFVRVVSEGMPARGDDREEFNNLNMSVTYTNMDGSPVDPGQLAQGSGFVASVSIQNPGTRGEYKNLALNQIFPSGWEINNLRLDEAEDRLKADKPTYQDIRDDRVYTYFDLGIGQRKTFKVLLTASYAGTYYLPAVTCDAMYDGSIYARKKGQVVTVVKNITQ
ncbi:MAG TPA: MG2 domain-containing protein [Chryseosolibacter sp.]|nr:MG2 domain-containing protein [Chryseosolibacter sp.]